MKTRLILVGGFLGAGKTTLLRTAAHRFVRRGLRVGMVTNDQAPALVDTAFLAHDNMDVAEVSGSCFCCNFDGLITAISQVRKTAEADIILAEPVGSCTDLSATIIQPLKENFSQGLSLAPLTVLVDPLRLGSLLKGGNAGLHASAAYILRKQIEEADLIAITKVDKLAAKTLERLYDRAQREFPGIEVLKLSAETEDGLDDWIETVLTRTDAGGRIVPVDYDTYAEGEAVLGWLNATVGLLAESTANWRLVTENLLRALASDFDRQGASVGHVKVILETNGKCILGNLTGDTGTLCIRGDEATATCAKMTINARVEMSPTQLEQAVENALATAVPPSGKASRVVWECLSPGRPMPTHRYDYVVDASRG